MGDKYIENPETIGEHLRNRRLELGLTQKEVTEEMGVSEDSIRFWELGQAHPSISHMPKIIQFLGYNPVEVETSTFGGQIYTYRMANGLSRKNMGKLLEVNATTIGAWEGGEHRPIGGRLKTLLEILSSAENKLAGKE